jgi:hypothetical protein
LLAVYVGVSVATLGVVLGYVDQSGARIGHGTPLRFSRAAAQATLSVLPPGGTVLIGGPALETPVLRFALGFETPSQGFDDCGAPPPDGAVYLLTRQRSPAADALTAAGAPLLARVERGADAYLVLGQPRAGPTVPVNAADCSR